MADRYVIDGRIVTAGRGVAGVRPDPAPDPHAASGRRWRSMWRASSSTTRRMRRPTRSPWCRSGGSGAREPRVAAAIRLMEAALDRPLASAAIARRVGVSVRTLETLFAPGARGRAGGLRGAAPAAGGAEDGDGYRPAARPRSRSGPASPRPRRSPTASGGTPGGRPATAARGADVAAGLRRVITRIRAVWNRYGPRMEFLWIVKWSGLSRGGPPRSGRTEPASRGRVGLAELQAQGAVEDVAGRRAGRRRRRGGRSGRARGSPRRGSGGGRPRRAARPGRGPCRSASAIARTAAVSSSTMIGARPSSGSSRRSTEGLVVSVRAMAASAARRRKAGCPCCRAAPRGAGRGRRRRRGPSGRAVPPRSGSPRR